MKWLVVCDPDLTVEDYDDILSGVPPANEVAVCPDGWRAVYLEASVEQVKPLTEMEEQVCRVRPVWEESHLSSAELLLLGRQLARVREARRQPKENPSVTEEGKQEE